MAVTPQTNTTLASIAEVLKANDNFVVCGHVSPDGDCLGCQLGLASALSRLGKSVTCVLVKDEPIERALRFLPGAEHLIPAEKFEGACDVFVGVDVPTRERIGEAACAIHDVAKTTITIDHHAVDSTMADYVYVDPDAAAACMLVWDLVGLLGVDRGGAVASCCYTGLMTDTGRFQFQNTDVFALRAACEMVACGADAATLATQVFQNRSIASLKLAGRAVDRMQFGHNGDYVLSYVTQADFEEFGAVKADAEPIINTLRTVEGTRVACMLREVDGKIRGGLRSKDETDISVLARSFGGGGHKAASGFTLDCSLDEAVQKVREGLDSLLDGTLGTGE